MYVYIYIYTYIIYVCVCAEEEEETFEVGAVIEEVDNGVANVPRVAKKVLPRTHRAPKGTVRVSLSSAKLNCRRTCIGLRKY